MNSIYRYLTQPVNLNRFSWPISGFPSPAIAKPEPAVERTEAPTDAGLDAGRPESKGDVALPVENNTTLANAASTTRSSTALLIILAMVLSFMLGFMCRTLVMKAEDFVVFSPSNHPDARPSWTEFQRLLQVDALGRRFILGIAGNHGG